MTSSSFSKKVRKTKDLPLIMTVEETSNNLRVSITTCYKSTQDGKVTSQKVCRSFVIYKERKKQLA